MYESFFGLAEAPFQLAPDPRFFFASKGHKRALDSLRFGLSQGEGFVILTGEVGAGKTTLLTHMVATLDRARFAAATIVTTQLEADDFLRMIATEFGINPEGVSKAALLGRLKTHFDGLVAQGKVPLIIVDESQNLPQSSLEELRMLSNFRFRERGSVLTALVGQPQFREKLNLPDLSQLRQRVVVSYHLGPLSEEEIGDYLHNRLAQAGWTGDPEIDPGAYAAIYAATLGVPRLINLLLNRTLLYLFLEKRHDLKAQDIDAVAADLRSELEAWPVVPPPSQATRSKEPTRAARISRKNAKVE